MAKQQPDLRIDRLGTHLFQVTRKNGSNFLKWDWDKLLEEVQAATAGKTVAKIDLVKETETKVTKTRTKKAEPVTEKKPAAKKSPAKKAKK